MSLSSWHRLCLIKLHWKLALSCRDRSSVTCVNDELEAEPLSSELTVIECLHFIPTVGCTAVWCTFELWYSEVLSTAIIVLSLSWTHWNWFCWVNFDLSSQRSQSESHLVDIEVNSTSQGWTDFKGRMTQYSQCTWSFWQDSHSVPSSHLTFLFSQKLHVCDFQSVSATHNHWLTYMLSSWLLSLQNTNLLFLWQQHSVLCSKETQVLS